MVAVTNWDLILYPLFVVIVTLLLIKKQDTVDGALEQDDEVAIYCKKSGEVLNVNSLLGTATDTTNAAHGSVNDYR